MRWLWISYQYFNELAKDDSLHVWMAVSVWTVLDAIQHTIVGLKYSPLSLTIPLNSPFAVIMITVIDNEFFFRI